MNGKVQPRHRPKVQPFFLMAARGRSEIKAGLAVIVRPAVVLESHDTSKVIVAGFTSHTPTILADYQCSNSCTAEFSMSRGLDDCRRIRLHNIKERLIGGWQQEAVVRQSGRDQFALTFAQPNMAYT